MKPTPSASTKSGVHWTQFLSTELTDTAGQPVDWTDHRAAHRAVSRLFPPRLPGAPGERRATAGILYRLDVLVPGEPAVVLVQSLVPPELTPALSRSTEVSKRAWEFAAGDRIVLRVAVNPVRRTTRQYTDTSKTRTSETSNVARGPQASSPRNRTHTKQTASVIPVAEMGGWLLERFGRALRDVEFGNHFRDTWKSGPQKLVVDTLDLQATVSDVEEFDWLRLHGVGRAKSYGCGLLTARRVS